MSRLCVLPLTPVLLDVAFAITFYLPVRSSKCLQEKIHKDMLLAGEYEVSGQTKTTTSLMIIAEFGQTLYTKENATKGTFSFTTEYDDHFDVCFHSKYPMDPTNTQLLLFSIISMSCLSALATWQVFYLRRFFKAKNLIE